MKFLCVLALLTLLAPGCMECQRGDIACWQDEARLVGSAAAIAINHEAKPEQRALLAKAGPILLGFLQGDQANLAAAIQVWLDRELPSNPDNPALAALLAVELARLRARFGGEGLGVLNAGVEALVAGVRP